ncbi:hypothetical protein Z949_1501 [Sulfitobacter guttiformis KCTC 32187]|nr:hypothetical protein Z949_1501 [Sulfitobacter guttiformis KCTC 32187]
MDQPFLLMSFYEIVTGGAIRRGAAPLAVRLNFRQMCSVWRVNGYAIHCIFAWFDIIFLMLMII